MATVKSPGVAMELVYLPLSQPYPPRAGKQAQVALSHQSITINPTSSKDPPNSHKTSGQSTVLYIMQENVS